MNTEKGNVKAGQMKINYSCKYLGVFILILVLFSCKKGKAAAPELSVSASEISFPQDGATEDLTITANAQWNINFPIAEWLQISQTSGNSGNTQVHFTTGENNTGASRLAILVVSSTNGQARRVTVSQLSSMYPSYNATPQASDAIGMSSMAVQLAAKMKLGWNIGNTFEAPGGETGWGSSVITEDYIKLVKKQGFNAVRIPCSFDWSHLDNKATAHIDQNWLNRVKEVIGYCINNDMYVLLNIHWDDGWLENNCTPDKRDSVNAKQKAYWEQIATAMRDFDEHLLFASANEPNADDATKMGVLLSYHQIFVNAVRSTGGKNAYRCLVIQGSSDWISVDAFPTDPTPNRLMYEEHNYTPFQFCALSEDASWGKMFYYWGAGHHSTLEPDRNASWGEEDVQDAYFQKIKKQFVDKGIPVLMGEYGAYRRNGSGHEPIDLAAHNDAIDYWITYITKQAKAIGAVPFWWDTGGALDRANSTVKDQRTIDAILEGAK